jgi:hypothetical protein
MGRRVGGGVFPTVGAGAGRCSGSLEGRQRQHLTRPRAAIDVAGCIAISAVAPHALLLLLEVLLLAVVLGLGLRQGVCGGRPVSGGCG